MRIYSVGSGRSESKRSVLESSSSNNGNFFQGTTSLSNHYAVVNKSKTGTSVKQYEAPSGNRYTADSYSTVSHKEFKNTAFGEATDCNEYYRENYADLQDGEDAQGGQETKTAINREIKQNNPTAGEDISGMSNCLKIALSLLRKPYN